MEKFRCIIIDDEPLAIQVIEEHLENLDVVKCIGTYSSPTKAIPFLNKKKVDLVFLDINMSELSGLDFVKSLSAPPKIIFTTAYREFAVEAFELNAVDYLVKPIGFERFLKALNRFLDMAQQPKELEERREYIILRENKVNHKVFYGDILLIESMDNYLKVQARDKLITCYGRISELEEQLPSQFLRIHRSYIVNTDFLSSYSASTVEIDGRLLRIGRNFKDNVRKVLE